VRDVTGEQRGRRPIFNATLRAAAGWLFFRVARRVAGSLNRSSAIRLASEGGEAKAGAFAYAPCESSGGAPNAAIPASDLGHQERASAPIAQEHVRRRSKKKRGDLQRRTGSASLPAPAERFGPIISSNDQVLERTTHAKYWPMDGWLLPLNECDSQN
jgi:hypothetical protein